MGMEGCCLLGSIAHYRLFLMPWHKNNQAKSVLYLFSDGTAREVPLAKLKNEHMSTTFGKWLQREIGEQELHLPTQVTPHAAGYYVDTLGLSEFSRMFFEGMLKDVIPEAHIVDDLPDDAIIRMRDRTLHLMSLYEPLVCQMVLCRVVEMYLAYLTKILVEVFRARPETLLFDSEEQNERIDFILQYATRDELVSALAEKRVEKLSYTGTRALAAYFRRMKLPLIHSEQCMSTLVRLIELRNVIVHNNGVMSADFLKRWRDCPATAGENIALDMTSTGEARIFLANCVGDLDSRAISKFGLRCVTLTYKNKNSEP